MLSPSHLGTSARHAHIELAAHHAAVAARALREAWGRVAALLQGPCLGRSKARCGNTRPGQLHSSPAWRTGPSLLSGVLQIIAVGTGWLPPAGILTRQSHWLPEITAGQLHTPMPVPSVLERGGPVQIWPVWVQPWATAGASPLHSSSTAKSRVRAGAERMLVDTVLRVLRNF